MKEYPGDKASNVSQHSWSKSNSGSILPPTRASSRAAPKKTKLSAAVHGRAPAIHGYDGAAIWKGRTWISNPEVRLPLCRDYSRLFARKGLSKALVVDSVTLADDPSLASSSFVLTALLSSFNSRLRVLRELENR